MNLQGGWFGAGALLGSKRRKGNTTTLLAAQRAGRQPKPLLSSIRYLQVRYHLLHFTDEARSFQSHNFSVHSNMEGRRQNRSLFSFCSTYLRPSIKDLSQEQHHRMNFALLNPWVVLANSTPAGEHSQTPQTGEKSLSGCLPPCELRESFGPLLQLVF